MTERLLTVAQVNMKYDILYKALTYWSVAE